MRLRAVKDRVDVHEPHLCPETTGGSTKEREVRPLAPTSDGVSCSHPDKPRGRETSPCERSEAGLDRDQGAAPRCS